MEEEKNERGQRDGRGRGGHGRGGGGRRGPRGRGRGGMGRDPVAATVKEVGAWFAGSLPDDWFTEPVTVTLDRDEIIVMGRLATPRTKKGDDQTVAELARIEQFREDSRDARIGVASRAQDKFERIVSWGAICGETKGMFTSASVPAMTRLAYEERATLDTLIDAGVARSRSEALAWCVKLVAANEAEWIGDLRDALSTVEQARKKGPGASKD